MKFGSPQREDETGIELTPLIDVVFLLLIFFMISTTFTKETKLKINLPQATGDTAVKEATQLEVHVGPNSEYAIASDVDEKAKVLINSSRATLLNALREFEDQPEMLLIIRADRKATHEAVIRVLDVAQQVGLSNITFATKQVSE